MSKTSTQPTDRADQRHPRQPGWDGTSSRRNTWRIVGFGVAAAAVIAGGLFFFTRSSAVEVIQGADRFPSQTLSDVVSYADAVVVAQVVAERRRPSDPDPDVAGGYIGRDVDLVVQEVVWTRDGAPSPTPTVTFVDSGWMQRGDRQVPVAIEGATRLEVDETYLIPLARDSNGQWFATTTRVALVVKADTTSRASSDTQAEAALAGRSLDEIGALLSDATPDPLAAKYAELPADLRMDAVRTDRDDG